MELIISASAAKPAAKPETTKSEAITTAHRDELVALLNRHAGTKSPFTFSKGKNKTQIKVTAGKASRIITINSITTLKGKVQKAGLKVGESNKILPVTTVTETRAKLTTLVNTVLKDVAGFEKIAVKGFQSTQGGATPRSNATPKQPVAKLPTTAPKAKAEPKGKTTKAEPAKAKHTAEKPVTKTKVNHKTPNAHKQGKTTQPKVEKLKHDAERMSKNK